MGIIIGISGEAEHGKDEIGLIIDELWAEKNYKGTKPNGVMRASFYNEFETIKFTDPINKIIQAITGLPMEYIMDKDKYNIPISWLNGKTLRDLKNEIGEGLKPILGEDIWIKSSFTRVNFRSNIKVTDVRFPLELNFLANKPNSILFFVHRPNHTASSLNDLNRHAISETIISKLDKSKFHYIVSNDGTRADLKQKIKAILNENEVWNRAIQDPM